jgi:coenzyme F420-reducing hydrogenase delta subunit
MAGTIIDRLVVELNLDGKKFGSGAAEAQSRLEKFRKLVAALGIDEAKLDQKQKLALNSLEKVATQSQRAARNCPRPPKLVRNSGAS